MTRSVEDLCHSPRALKPCKHATMEMLVCDPCIRERARVRKALALHRQANPYEMAGQPYGVVRLSWAAPLRELLTDDLRTPGKQA